MATPKKAALKKEQPSAKQVARKTKSKKVQQNRRDIVEQLWPEVSQDELWSRQTCDGYNSIPRTMPHIGAIIDSLSKNTPAFATYFALWCRVWDESYLRIQSPEILAAEAGFSGERKVTTWKSRMRILAELGFINAKVGDAGDFEYVLILNPHLVALKLHRDERLPKQLFRSLLIRAQEIGAKDFISALKSEDKET